MLDSCCSLRLPCAEMAWLSQTEQATPTLAEFSEAYRTKQGHLDSFAMVIVVSRTLSRCAQYMLHKHHASADNMPWHPQSRHAGMVSDVLLLEIQMGINKPIKQALAEHSSPDGFLDQRSSNALVFSRLLFHLCQCLMYHPFLLGERMYACNADPPKAFANHAMEIGRQASDDMINLLSRAKQAGCILLSSFSGYCATVAATANAVDFILADGDDATAFVESVQPCVEHLVWLSRYWNNAATMVRHPSRGFWCCFGPH